MILFAFSFVTFAVAGQEVNAPKEKTLSLEDAKTVNDVDKWYSNALVRLYTIEIFEIRLKAGKRILEIAKTDVEKKKGYQNQFAALTFLAKAGEKGSQEELDKLTKKLEADENFRSVIYDDQFQKIVNQFNLKNSNDFDKFKSELKKWLNKPFVTHKEVVRAGLQKAKIYADNVVKNDVGFFHKFIRELADYVRSSENTLDEKIKKDVLEQIEASNLTLQGNDLKLYGKTIDNADFDWNALRGKYVIVKFTATWCGPCKGEIPGLISAYEKYKDKGLEIVSVYIWERGDTTDSIVKKVKKFVQDEKITWPIILETLTEKAGQPKQGDFYGIQGVPTMLLIDKEGKIIDADARGQYLQEKLEEIFK
jgi:thiol-disulfide isomerase/thioredoxin